MKSFQPISIRPFDALAESIAYQQLNGKAAATIWGRVRALYPKTKWLDPAKVLATPDEKLRGAGLSRSKTAAIKDLAAKTIDGTVPSARALLRMSDDEIIARLTLVRGIGRWTVEMLLLFDLGRPDVWPVADYGVQKGFAKTFRQTKASHAETTDEVSARNGGRIAPLRPGISGERWINQRSQKVKTVTRITMGREFLCNSCNTLTV